jgi:hypothetical protein
MTLGMAVMEMTVMRMRTMMVQATMTTMPIRSMARQQKGSFELCCIRTLDDETGHFPMLLRDVLGELGNNVAPYYHKKRYIDPALSEFYLTRVHIRIADDFRGKRTISAHDSDGPLPTY